MVSLLPRKSTIFELFRAQGTVIKKATELFAEFANRFGEFDSYSARSKAIEREGDGVVRKLTYELAESFNTPLDREDIHPLMLDLDKIVNLINRAVQDTYLYGITEKPAIMDAFVSLIQGAAGELERLLTVFERRKYVAELAHAVEKIRGIEHQADVLYKESVHALFTSDQERLRTLFPNDSDSVISLKILAMNRFISNLEKIVDAFQVAANRIEGIAIKWS
jgi:uncharacterized protein Yka (UPF0111/DUF47 family)